MNLTWINVTRALICQSCIEPCADRSAGVMVQKEACMIHEYFIIGQSLWTNQCILIKSLTCSMRRTNICRKTTFASFAVCTTDKWGQYDWELLVNSDQDKTVNIQMNKATFLFSQIKSYRIIIRNQDLLFQVEFVEYFHRAFQDLINIVHAIRVTLHGQINERHLERDHILRWHVLARLKTKAIRQRNYHRL